VTVLAGHNTGAEVVAVYRDMLRSSAFPCLLVANAVEPADAGALRTALAGAGDQRFWIADRGRYHHNDDLRVGPLFESLAAFASGVAGVPLALHGARWLRFTRGDYALVKDDSRTRPPGRAVELTLDVSAAMCPEAGLVYSDGHDGVQVPQLPNLLVLVDRTPTSTRYDRPLTVKSGDGAEIIRLRMWLRPG
jgi:hypothetical protein